jgi:hypothetical protein
MSKMQVNILSMHTIRSPGKGGVGGWGEGGGIWQRGQVSSYTEETGAGPNIQERWAT